MVAPDKLPVVLQQSSSDCGVACLASVIRFFGGEERIEHLRHLSGTAIAGSTVLGLVEAARQLGMESCANKMNNDQTQGSSGCKFVMIDHEPLTINYFVVFF